MFSWVGYRWLQERYNVHPVQGFSLSSRIGKTRSKETSGGYTIETLTESYRPDDTFAAHLTFALKREGVHLEFLARLFDKTPQAELKEWIEKEPVGQYARRACFFYEWLTGRQIDYPDVASGNYVLAMPDNQYVTAIWHQKIARWRVWNNLCGTRSYCPTVRITPLVDESRIYDCWVHLQDLELEFGQETLMRSAVWLTTKESRASFLIEHESQQADRIKRFAAAIERLNGTAENPLSFDFLAILQAEILGDNALRKGIRESPVYVGHSTLSGEVVDYVAPLWSDIPEMLQGLVCFADRTDSIRWPLVRAAVLSFGFVFIHPMADGNGRISRFLINDTLRRDGESPPPYILPISSTIVNTPANRAAYDHSLEHYSKPFMRRYRSDCQFGEMVRSSDGIETNFQFDAYADAGFVWRYPDLTAQAEYLYQLVRETIEVELRKEAQDLTELYQTRLRIKEVLEGPDVEIDRIIRSIKQNGNVISGKLARDFPILTEPRLGQAVVDAIVGPVQTGPE